MRAIQFFQYKCLEEYLQKLQQEDLFDLPGEHKDIMIQHAEKLKEIYCNYRLSLEQVSVIITQYEEHKRTIMRLIKQHKSYKRSLKGKNIFKTNFQFP